ncbi:MAG TPA: hypothetical protein VMV82_01770 [Candidatus Dormibacteraeota bacterium]|nr:hypothetical protein [Candidatus Dormibacteraeota bacterium]
MWVSGQDGLQGRHVAVDIRSPGDRERDILEKIALYLSHGSVLVLDVAPASRSIVAHAPEGLRKYAGCEEFSHPAVPWLKFELYRALEI